ncbi:MAG: UvrD-helicase domain-containing protein, partial [Candidatus Binatia bacterium]|nr:UvrD-helicase domain-containing protein [Candidatus Binatia bacterium]
ALTFTNKAANEIKLRLRERLQSYLDADLAGSPATEADKKTAAEVAALIRRYQLSKDELNGRLLEAIRHIERAEIGTIHSFAATLLRLYPLEAEVDPQFREDDGKQFERLFDEQWDLWLDQELALTGSHAGDWRIVLPKLPLEQIKTLAQSLCAETVEIGRDGEKSGALPEALSRWLKNLATRAAALVERHPEDRQNEKLARAAKAIIDACRHTGSIAENSLTEERGLLAEKSINTKLKGWTAEDVAEAQELVRAAQGLAQVDEDLTMLLWRLLAPFAVQFRRFFTHEGFVSFDGLLIRARNLVRDHPRVREEIKRQYRAILIDEFQDTDPIQYEILLYLAERSGQSARDWRAVELTPGKAFVVGDPKQSIYAFRRADIEAYLEVIEKIIKAQDGIECRLTTNFRSDAEILGVVNGVFETLMQPRDGLQPPYIAIHPPAPTELDNRKLHSSPRLAKVSLRKIVAEGAALDAETARRLEGESLARWLRDEMIEKASITNARGEQVLVQPRDVAILFRKLTDIHDYLEPFRRRHIRYVVAGERHFYAAKEIIDAVNLLRAIDNPHDRLALVGVLRSPLGALPDKLIYDLHRRDLLDYRKGERLNGKEFPGAVAELYQTLTRLHDDTRLLPVGEAIARIFDSLPVRLLAACAFHGEQAVANLDKLRQQAEQLGREGLMTLKETIRQLQQHVLDVKEEGESVLAEESIDAVRIMSIHKAKGLEFPVVVLAGCHGGTNARQAKSAEALSDWSSGLTGLRVGPIWDLPGLYIAEKARLRAEEEQKRVFYVAMTRPREHLIISCAPTSRRSGGSFLAMLGEALGIESDDIAESKIVSTGAGKMAIQVVTESLAAPGRAESAGTRASGKRDWRPYVDLWSRRRSDFATAMKSPVFLTPTLLKRQEAELSEAAVPHQQAPLKRTLAMLIGELAHRFLQSWDFALDARAFMDPLKLTIGHWLPQDYRPQQAALQNELEEIFTAFFRSKAYGELAQARILGREVPLLVPWNGQIMEGVIDVIYERDGLLYLADYKTDRIAREELQHGAERYRQQAQTYAEAARLSLKREVAAFKLIFLRLGEAVEITAEKNNE